MANAAILLCAGRSKRMGPHTSDKILAPVGGKPVFMHSLEAFAESGAVETLLFVCRDEAQWHAIEESVPKAFRNKLELNWTLGGAERQDSVFRALSELSLATDAVFIHDCARPMIRPAMIACLESIVIKDKCVSLAHPMTDTIKEVRKDIRTTRQLRIRDLDRRRLWAMETPQVFTHELIFEAYRLLRLDNVRVTDDTAAASRAGHRVTLLPNPLPNPKLTHPADFGYVEYLLTERGRGEAPEVGPDALMRLTQLEPDSTAENGLTNDTDTSA